MPSEPRVLYLMRHSDVEQDYAHRYLGRSNPGLSPPGRQRAMNLGERMRLTHASIWTSPARRALETARLAFPGASPEVQPLAQELDFGVLDGLLPGEAERLFPEAFRHICKHPFDARPFGGENWGDVSRRAAMLRGALESGDTAVLLISHRYFLRALVEQLTVERSPGDVVDLACCEILMLRQDGHGRLIGVRAHA